MSSYLLLCDNNHLQTTTYNAVKDNNDLQYHNDIINIDNLRKNEEKRENAWEDMSLERNEEKNTENYMRSERNI
jgi:hypothetical protein